MASNRIKAVVVVAIAQVDQAKNGNGGPQAEAGGAVKLSWVISIETRPGIGGIGKQIGYRRQLRALEYMPTQFCRVFIQQTPTDRVILGSRTNRIERVATQKYGITPEGGVDALDIKRRAAHKEAFVPNIASRD